MSLFDGKSKEDLLRLLHGFLAKGEWGPAASCADYVLEHYGDDFEAACGLQRSAIKIAGECARLVVEKTEALGLAVHASTAAFARVARANELVARLDQR